MLQAEIQISRLHPRQGMILLFKDGTFATEDGLIQYVTYIPFKDKLRQLPLLICGYQANSFPRSTSRFQLNQVRRISHITTQLSIYRSDFYFRHDLLCDKLRAAFCFYLERCNIQV